MPCRIVVRMKNDRTLEIEKMDYEGFHTRPMSWESACATFENLAAGGCGAQLRERIIAAVDRLEECPARDLGGLIAQVRIPKS